ncbi:hypothetical protein ABZP36_033472 [Zizania latifolia]
MQGKKDEQPAGGGKGKDPSPPQPPPRHEANANGGHRLGPRRPRVRGEVAAVGFMVAAAAYFFLADALAVPVEGEGDDRDDPPAAWSFAAYMLWIAGVNLFVLVSLMN